MINTYKKFTIPLKVDFNIIYHLIFSVSFGILFFLCIFTLLTSGTRIQNQHRMQNEFQFIHTFFYQIDELNSSYSNLNNNQKQIPLDFKTLNTALNSSQLAILNTLGLLENHPIVQDSHLNSNQIETFLGRATIYPYSLPDRINGKTNEINAKRDDFKLSYTIDYPTVDENSCMSFLSYLKNNPIAYNVVINNIEISDVSTMTNSISGNETNFYSICQTSHKKPYNIIYISN
jgi:hypothetical protein